MTNSATPAPAALRPRERATEASRGAVGVLAVGSAGMLMLLCATQARRSAHVRPRVPAEPGRERRLAARLLHAGSCTLAASVALDSAAEHYRAGFHNPFMFAGPSAAAITLAAAAKGAASAGPASPRRAGIFALAALAGCVGTAFHARNLLRRRSLGAVAALLHGAPAGAPLGLSFAGLFGWAGEALLLPPGGARTPLPLAKALAAAAAAGLAGTAAEAGLLHFRGAFASREMYLPVLLPPLAALALAGAASRPSPRRLRAARALVGSTAVLGAAGVAFHARGVGRRMGGWRNWRQNLLAGPPLPAPPAFTGMSLAGLAGLILLGGGGS
ncbi:MAG TPA: hypothetical protein VHG08_19330 [Longimicrobium sp.]|nr:hypothetical protein [Longimicrobium sp.]